MDDELARWLAERDPTADWESTSAAAKNLAPKLLGLSINAASQLAEKNAVVLRVLTSKRAQTRDLRPNRVNVAVEHGVVVSAEVY